MRQLRRLRWHNSSRFQLNRAPANMRPWLQGSGSLTQQLICACPGNFSVQLLQQRLGHPDRHEARLLRIDRQQKVLIREVHLLCDTTPWVYARTLIPFSSLRGPAQRLAAIGSRPLGALLFSAPSLCRSALQIRRMGLREAKLSTHQSHQPIWGRRSLFRIGNHPLLVSEFFLPSLQRVAYPSGNSRPLRPRRVTKPLRR